MNDHYEEWGSIELRRTPGRAGGSEVVFRLGADVDLDTAFEEMECFLRACGYAFDGHLGIVDEPE